MPFVELLDTGLPQLEEHASCDPLLKAVVGSGRGTHLGLAQGLPLAATAQDEENGIGALTVRDARASSAEPVGVHLLWTAWLADRPACSGEAQAGGRAVVCSRCVPVTAGSLVLHSSPIVYRGMRVGREHTPPTHPRAS